MQSWCLRFCALLMTAVVGISVSVGAASAASAAPTDPAKSADATHSATHSAAARALPGKAQWEADVKQAMKGSKRWLRAWVAREANRENPRKLALNLDIDNSAMASHYAYGTATPYVIGLTRLAKRKGVSIFFNTARVGSQLSKARTLLTNAGYTVDKLCGRSSTKVGLVAGKKACRKSFRKQGYVLIGNIGNRPTDFEGGGYKRGFKLPDYNLQLN